MIRLAGFAWKWDFQMPWRRRKTPRRCIDFVWCESHWNGIGKEDWCENLGWRLSQGTGWWGWGWWLVAYFKIPIFGWHDMFLWIGNWFVQFLTWGRTYLKTSCLVSWWLPACASWLADFWLATVWRHQFIFLADGTHYLTGFHMRVWWHDDSISNISGLVQPCRMVYPDSLAMHESS